MYEALNERVIALPLNEEKKTDSGIFLASENQACVKYKVCYTNNLTKHLQDRIIYAEARYLNYQLPDVGKDGETYVVIPLSEILAVKA